MVPLLRCFPVYRSSDSILFLKLPVIKPFFLKLAFCRPRISFLTFEKESEGNWLNEGVALPRAFSTITSQLKCQPRARMGFATPHDLLIVIAPPKMSQMQLIIVSYICENKTLNCFFCCSIFSEKLLYLKVEFGGWQDCSVGRGTDHTVWWSDLYP